MLLYDDQPMQNLQPTSASGPVTDEQRAYALDALNATRISLRQSLEGLTDAQLSYKPAPDRWSVAECTEHIALVERGIFGGIQKGMSYPADPARRAEVRLSDVDVIKAVRSRAVTLPAPDPFIPTGRFGSTAAALLDFEQQRDIAIAYVQAQTDDLRTHYFRHIALGWLDIYQAVLLLSAHVERHRKQIDELKSSPDFPA
ncbi:DinB family protein [Spirosoma sp. 209]|uniref:DinB family protein n=1 Tax=Spirosoma sp. 209 TaxID=1955701 RepID=UPI001F373E00|nr:DinB family protein [Spirosoma sp. 209]